MRFQDLENGWPLQARPSSPPNRKAMHSHVSGHVRSQLLGVVLANEK
jgi:hypothetical protein